VSDRHGCVIDEVCVSRDQQAGPIGISGTVGLSGEKGNVPPLENPRSYICYRYGGSCSMHKIFPLHVTSRAGSVLAFYVGIGIDIGIIDPCPISTSCLL